MLFTGDKNMVHGVHTSLISVEPHEVERKEDRQKRTKNFELEWWSHRGNTKEAYKMTKPGNTTSLCRAPDLKPPSKFFVYLCNLNTGPAGSLGRLIGRTAPMGSPEDNLPDGGHRLNILPKKIN